MFEQTFKNIDDVLWKEAGCTTELDYTEQTSWMLFLKYLDDLEARRKHEADSTGSPMRRSSTSASLVRLGRAEEGGRLLRPRQGADRRRPHRLRERRPVSLPARLQAARRPAPTRSNTRSGKSSARSKTSSRAATPCATRSNSWTRSASARKRRSTTFPPLRSQDQGHGQCGPERRRILHAAPAHPRHDWRFDGGRRQHYLAVHAMAR